MIDPDADPSQLDLEDDLPQRQASFVFWRPGVASSDVAAAIAAVEEDVNQLSLSLFLDGLCSG